LFFRLLQACVATSMALSRAIVRDMVDQDQAASTIGYITMGMALVPMVGPMVGGFLDQLFNWQATFVFLMIAGSAVFTICFLDQGFRPAGRDIVCGFNCLWTFASSKRCRHRRASCRLPCW